MDAYSDDIAPSRELMWDSHVDEDFGDLLDFIMKNAIPEVVSSPNYSYQGNINSESDSIRSDETVITEEREVSRKSRSSLLRSIQAFVDLQPGFPCSFTCQDNKTLSEIVQRQLIMDEIRSQLDANTLRVYARRHGRSATSRRRYGSWLTIPKRRGVKLQPSYLALMERMNPDLFNGIHSGEMDRIPLPPDNMQ
ncbi:hypothetical protein Aduo_012453 [Ancylostoma duodenale]